MGSAGRAERLATTRRPCTRAAPLWIYLTRAGGAGFTPRRQAATCWQGMDLVLGVGDVSGNGVPDVLAREKATGYLWLCPGTSTGLLGTQTGIGTGWESSTRWPPPAT